LSYRLYRAVTGLLWPLALSTAAARSLTGGPEWRERVGDLSGAPRGSVWLHAASVGEVAAVTPLVRAIESTGPAVFLSVVTPTGRAAADRSGASSAGFAPLDFAPAVRRLLGRLEPRALLLTETEIWPNTVFESHRAGVPTGVVNGRLSSGSLRRYLLPGSPVREPVSRLAFAACRTEADARHYIRLGVDETLVHVVGDMKYDKLEKPLGSEERAELRAELGVPREAAVVVFGSVRPLEEAAVARAAAQVLSSVARSFVIAAPRHLDRTASLRTELSARGVATRLRSAGGSPEAGARAIVLDTTGELSRVYALATVAFVGGTLYSYGGHDPLEPAAQGVPVVLGRNTESCRESARRLVEAGGAFEVGSPDELAGALLAILSDERRRDEAARLALESVASGRGATRRTMELLTRMGILDGDGA
jgi:3-deoxy-D-manno-octulosonic-acid transferase